MFRENIHKQVALPFDGLSSESDDVMHVQLQEKESQATSPQLECESYLLGSSGTTDTLAFSRKCCLPFDVSGAFGSLSLSLSRQTLMQLRLASMVYQSFCLSLLHESIATPS